MFDDQTLCRLATLFDAIWQCLILFGKIWNPSNIRSKSMKHRYCSRVWCVMFGSRGRLHQIHLARACVFRCGFWSYASKMAFKSVFDGLFDTRLAASSDTGKVCAPSILRLTRVNSLLTLVWPALYSLRCNQTDNWRINRLFLLLRFRYCRCQVKGRHHHFIVSLNCLISILFSWLIVNVSFW